MNKVKDYISSPFSCIKGVVGMDDFEGIDFCFDDFINPDGTINEEVDKRVNGEV